MIEDAIDKQQGIKLAVIDRPSVRALVGGFQSSLAAAATAGRNVHQLVLDWQDQVDRYTATLSPTDQESFLVLYTQEMDASTRATLDRTAQIHAQAAVQQMNTAKATGQVGIWLTLIAFFATIITLIRLWQ